MNIKHFIARVFSVLLIGAFVFVLAPTVQAASVSTDGFDPGANGIVYSLVVQPDGKILVGGDFTTLGGTPRSYIGRINPDGTLDTGFNPGANGSVRALAIEPDGKILVGGNFTSLGGSSCVRICRLNTNGTLDGSFTPGSGANDKILVMIVQPDGKVLVGGEFTTLNGVSHNHIGRINSDGSVDGSFTPVADGPVYALAIQQNRMILVGGSFSNLDGSSVINIGRLNTNGTLDGGFNPGAGSPVRALIVQPDGKILVGGDFTTLGGGGSRNHIGRLSPSGSLDSFNPGATGAVRTLKLQPDGKILVGGDFTTLGGSSRNYIGRLNPAGALDSFNPGTGGTVYSLAVQPDGKVLAGGNFSILGGSIRNYLGRLYPDGSLDSTLNPGADNIVHALAIQADGKILVGGTFTQLAGTSRSYIGRLNPDGSLDTFNPGASAVGGGTVWAIVIQPDGKIIVGGAFTTLAGQPRQNIGRLEANGNIDSTFNPGASSEVLSLALQSDGKILVGGKFTTLASNPRARIGRLEATGAIDSAFNPGASSVAGAEVWSLAVQPDGKILVGGSFTTLAGQLRQNIGRLDATGAIDLNFNPGASDIVYAFTVQPYGKILVGGAFLSLGGNSTHAHIGRLNSTGTLDTGFSSTANGIVYALALQTDGKILAGGAFTTLGGGARSSIGRFNANGSLDTSFIPGANNTVNALAIQQDGKILAGGAFTSLGYGSRNHIGRLSNDTAAMQNLTSNNSTGILNWLRNGAAPEVNYVTFESSLDGVTFSPLGAGTRMAGGWRLTGLTLPESMNLIIRARGYYATANHNGSSSVIESMRNMYLDSTLPAVKSIIRANSDPTKAASVDFTITFSESVSGVDSTDFALITTGITGAGITGVSGSGDAYTVTVNTGNSSGTLRLDVVNDDSILDLSGNTLMDNFSSGDTYTIDRTPPTVFTSLRASPNPNSSLSVNYTVTFSESVTGVDIGDFELATDGVTGLVSSVIPIDTQNYTVTIDSISGTGTLRLDVKGSAIIQDLAANSFSGGYTSGEVYAITSKPIVLSSVRVDPDPTKSTSLRFTVAFSKSVTGVNTIAPFDDFSLTVSGISGASITSVTGSGTNYTITVNTGSGSGSLRLDVLNDGTIIDGSSNPLFAAYSSGETYTIDRTAPTVESILRNNPDPTKTASVDYIVTFSEGVTGVETIDFILTTSGISGTPSTTSVSGSGSTYTVTVTTGSGNGTLRLDVSGSATIQDMLTNSISGGYTGGEIYTIDRTAPNVNSIARANPSPTSAPSVDFNVTFSESVSGVDAADFFLSTSGVSGEAITSISGTGSTRTVTVSTGSGTGTIRLDVVNDLSIVDGATNPLSGGFSEGETYTIDQTPPIVQSIECNNSNPTNAANVDFLVTFSKSVTGVDTIAPFIDFSISASGPTGAMITAVSGSGASRTLTVNTGTGDGMLRVDVPDTATITDLSGNQLTSLPYSVGESYTIDKTAPDTRIDSFPPNPSASSNATFTFSSPDDTQATFECQLDGGVFSACTSPKNYTGLFRGSHTFIARAKDFAGNLDTSPPSYTWYINIYQIFLPLVFK